MRPLHGHSGRTRSPEEIWEAPFLWVQARAEHKLNRKDDAIKTLDEAIRWTTRPYPSIQGNGDSGFGYPSKDTPRARWEMKATFAAYYLERGLRGDSDRVEKVFKDGISFRESFSDAEFPAKQLQVALAELRYGKFLVEQGRFDRAEEPLLSAYKKLSENPDAAPATAQSAATQLVRVYEETNRSDEAVVSHHKLNDLDPASDEKGEH